MKGKSRFKEFELCLFPRLEKEKRNSAKGVKEHGQPCADDKPTSLCLSERNRFRFCFLRPFTAKDERTYTTEN